MSQIIWESCMTQEEYSAIPLGSTLYLHDNGTYIKVGGWGSYHDSLLLDVETSQLKAPESVVTFRQHLGKLEMDIVEDLRTTDRSSNPEFFNRAADEITRLRAELAAMESTRATWDKVLQSKISGLEEQLRLMRNSALGDRYYMKLADEQEPIAWVRMNGAVEWRKEPTPIFGTPLYAAPKGQK